MNWTLLLPYTWNPILAYQLLFHNDPQFGAKALSALFIHVIIGITILFIGWALTLTIFSIIKTQGYLAKLPKDGDPMNLENSTELPLLSEWKQHLLTIEHRDGTGRTSIRRSVGAAEIFRDNLLVPDFMRSRLFISIPGILTGIGVLGTFVGLQIGMGGLDLSNASELDKSIIPLIQGCVIAFSTSVWGVSASLSFSGLEKFLDRFALGRIRKLQNSFDALYRPYVPEEALIGMEQSSRGTEEILKGLAVAIGDEMQKAIGRLGNEIKDAVAKATSDGQDTLMAKSAEVLSETITKELKNLGDQIVKMGEQFKTQFTGASNDLKESVGNFQPAIKNATNVITEFSDSFNDLKTYLKKLPTNQEEFEKNRAASEDERNKLLLEMTGDLTDKVGIATEQFSKVSDLTQNLREAAKTLDDASNELAVFGQHVLDASTNQNEASKAALSAALAGQRTANVFEPIPETISELTKGLHEAGKKIVEGAESSHEFYNQLIDLQTKWFNGAELGLNAMKERLQSIIGAYGDQIEGNTRNLMSQWTGEVANCLQSYQSQVEQLQEGLDALQEVISQIKKR